MTAQELLQRLQEIVAEDPTAAELEVETEGCDCFGDVQTVEIGVDLLGEADRAIILFRKRATA